MWGGATLRPMSVRHTSRLLAIVHDESVRNALQELVESAGLSTACFGSARQFLDSARLRAAVPSHRHLGLGTSPSSSGPCEPQVLPTNSLAEQSIEVFVTGTTVALFPEH